MALKANASRLEKWAEQHQQLAEDARNKAEEARKCEEQKQAAKEAKSKKKKQKEPHRGQKVKPKGEDGDTPEGGLTNKTFYPMYQKAMMGLSKECLVHIKVEKDPKLYKQFIEKVVQHISALDTSVRDVKADDVLVTIKDSSCKFVTGVDKEESEEDEDDEDTISPHDVINTFQAREVTRETREAISRCFRHMSEAHESMWEAFIEAGELTHILPKRGLTLLLELHGHWFSDNTIH